MCVWGSVAYLHFLHHLLAEGAHLGGAGDDHVLGALVLAGHPVEGAALILHVGVEVCLEEDKGKGGVVTQRGPLGGHGPGPRARTPSRWGMLRENTDVGPQKASLSVHTQAWGKVSLCDRNSGKSLAPAAHQVPTAQQTGPHIGLQRNETLPVPFSNGSGGPALAISVTP